ncbi:hypothetical protein PVAND_008863 [Polypedilum vanderplanki]|uniref:Chitin-binding type-2 domain-containing protein n=1 Tax=Polypedilum vanderplanki TaxID=319348 RepID=A0A9J6CAY8_POLVA|nr:hypothetical protein PVAND_008863 [Polypedilum vanderplanki]
MKLIVFIFAFAAIVAFVASQQAPDCVAIGKSTPEDISKYYHPHESDCNLFYQCADYGLVLKACPDDLHFDRNEHICGYPEDVTC